MAYGNLTYNVTLAQNKLDGIIDKALDQALGKEELEINGVEVELKKAGTAISSLEGKSLTIQVPVDIALKRQAGLFTVEGNGGLSLKLKINYDINNNIQLKTKTEMISHEWLTKPKLEIGALNIPVETLTNLVLNHYESILTAKVDNEINGKANLTGYLNQAIYTLESQINKSIPLDSTLDIKFDKIENLTPTSKENKVSVEGAMGFALSLQDSGKVKDDMLPSVGWISKLPKSIPAGVTISLGYTDIAKELVSRLSNVNMGGRNFEITHIDLSYEDHLKILLELNEPIKGNVVITGLPFFDKGTGVLDAKNIDVNVNPSNIIYKLTAPLVNKFAEGKISEYLPFNMKEMIRKNLSKMPSNINITNGSIRPNIEDILIHDITFTDKDIEVYLTLEGLHLDLELT